MFHKMTADQWYAVINTNLNSLFNMSPAPDRDGMRERGFGRIIYISSINGQKGQMGQVNYSASKAGDIGFIKALAQENATRASPSTASAPATSRTEMVMAVPKEVLDKAHHPADPGRPARRARGSGALRRFPRFRPVGLHHRDVLAANGGQYMA